MATTYLQFTATGVAQLNNKRRWAEWGFLICHFHTTCSESKGGPRLSLKGVKSSERKTDWARTHHCRGEKKQHTDVESVSGDGGGGKGERGGLKEIGTQ